VTIGCVTEAIHKGSARDIVIERCLVGVNVYIRSPIVFMVKIKMKIVFNGVIFPLLLLKFIFVSVLFRVWILVKIITVVCFVFHRDKGRIMIVIANIGHLVKFEVGSKVANRFIIFTGWFFYFLLCVLW
jgi:hypothetical protein